MRREGLVPKLARGGADRRGPATRTSLHRSRRLLGAELVERLVAWAQAAIGLDEVQPLRPTDRAPLVAVQVGDQAVVQCVRSEPDAALGQLGQEEKSN